MAVIGGHAQIQLFRAVVDECGFIDMNGQMVASTAETFPLPFSVIVVEVIAATKALRFVNDLGLPSIVPEGDYKITIDALAGENSYLTKLDTWLMKQRSLLRILRILNLVMY